MVNDKTPVALALAVLVLVLCSAAVPVGANEYDQFVANQNYRDSPVERWVAGNMGGNLPNMRDDLLRRKDAGEGFAQRHFHAWTNGDNWDWQRDHKKVSGFDFPDYGYPFGRA